MLLSLLVSFLIPLTTLAAHPDSFATKNVKYQTYFGECPAKSSGMFGVIVMKEFEKNYSLKEVKEKILKEKLDEKFFLSDYKISYNPVIKTLKISLECPEPLAKVQVYKSNGEEHYSAILGDNTKLYEPQYENLMKAEKKLSFNLPLVALTMEQIDSNAPAILAQFIKAMEVDLRGTISEMLLNKGNELTIVFSLGGRATSVFMGADLWEDKLTKLTKIVGFVKESKRYPSSINLVNAKKVVVKFSDKI